MRRFGFRILKLLGMVLVLFLGVAGSFYWLFIGWVPTADFPPPGSRTEAQTQDITWARRYANLDRSFDEDERAAYQKHLDGLEVRAGKMSDAEFEFEFSKAVALADNAHTNSSPIGRSKRLNRLPVRFAWFDDALHIIQTTTERANLLGLEVTGFDEASTEEVVRAMLPTHGGPENRRRFMATLPLSSPEFLHAARVTKTAREVTLHFAAAPSLTLAAMPADTEHWTPYGRVALEYAVPEYDRDTWVSLMQGKEPPIPLQNYGDPYVKRHLVANDTRGDIYYVKLNYNYSVEGRDLAAWLKEAESEMRVLRPRYVVFDIRYNGGGTDITSPIAKILPDILPSNGLLFVITSAETFSAGVGAASEFKLYMGSRARVVGTPAGDRLRFWANGGSLFRLPNSGIAVPVWRALEDYKDGCWSITQCFWLSPGFMRRGVETLDPDLRAPLTFEAYSAGRDPSMEAVLAAIEAHEAG